MVTINFVDTPLAEVVSFLSSLSKVNIVLDPDIEGDAVRHRPVTLDLNQASLSAVLERIAGKDLTVTVKDNVVILSEHSPKPPLELKKQE